MTRLLFLALMCLAAYAIFVRQWPSLRSRRLSLVWAGATLFALLSWALPILMGGEIAVVGMPMKLAGIVLFMFAFGVMMVGGPLLLLQRIAGWWGRSETGESIDASRRQFLGVAGKGVPLAAAVGSVGGLAGGISGFTLKNVDVKIPDLPEALEGFRIGQLTDVHVGPFIEVEFLQKAVAALDAAGVDLQVQTGDLIDELEFLDGTMAALDSVKAPHGMIAVLGNHEHWRGPKSIRRGFASCKRVKLLDDESVVLDVKGTPLRVVGVDYPMRHLGEKYAVMKASAEKAFSSKSDGETVLCLSHHPDFFPVAAERGAHLTLSGHTHGGQLAFFGIPVFFFAFKYMLGLYRRGGSQLYVSGGTGHWLPMRLGVPPEITVLTLKRA